MSAQTQRTAAGANKLPVEEFDDYVAVYSNDEALKAASDRTHLFASARLWKTSEVSVL